MPALSWGPKRLHLDLVTTTPQLQVAVQHQRHPEPGWVVLLPLMVEVLMWTLGRSRTGSSTQVSFWPIAEEGKSFLGLSSGSMKQEGFQSHLKHVSLCWLIGCLPVPLHPAVTSHCSRDSPQPPRAPHGAANTTQLTKGPVASLIEELVSRRPQWRYF